MNATRHAFLPALIVGAFALLFSMCAMLVAAPSAYADSVKPTSVMLQADNFITSKGIDVTKEVATIDVSSGDTLFNLTVDDRYSQSKTHGKISCIRSLMRVDEKGNAQTIQRANNTDTMSFRARQLKAGEGLALKTYTNAECDENGNVIKHTGYSSRYIANLNIETVDATDVEEPSWELGEEGFSWTLNNTGFKFVDGTTIELNALHLPVTYKHKSDGTTVVGIGCNAEDAEFYSAVKNRNVWNKYTDEEIASKTKAIDDAWLNNKLGTWGDKGLDWSLFGYAEFNTKDPDANWSVTLCGRIGFAVEGHAQYFIFTGDLNAGLGGDLIASLTRHPKTQSFSGTLSIGAYGELELYVGLGCQYIASIGVYGAGSIHAGVDLLPKEDLGFNDVYVRGDVGVKAKAFGFTVATWRILEGQKDLYKRQRPSTMRSQANPENEDEQATGIASVDANAVYPEIARDYLDKGFEWNGPSTSAAAESSYPLAAQGTIGTQAIEPNEDAETTTNDEYNFGNLVVGNTYSETGVQTASNGTDAIMVFVADANQLGDEVAARKSANRGVLVYSRYNAAQNTWSAPKPVQAHGGDDQCADYNPSVCMAEDGTAYVAWLNAESAIAGTMTIGEVADNLLVNVAKISEDDAVAVKTVANSQAPNSMPAVPRICIANDQPCVAWYTNEIGEDADESQVIGLSGSHEVCFARPIENAGFDGEWTTTTHLMLDANGAKAEGAITSFALGNLEGTPTCAWTFDPDFLQHANAGTGTLDNSHLFLATCEGNQAQVASKAANAQFAKKGSTDVLTFYQDGAVMSVQAANAQPDVVLPNDEAIAVPSANYLITGDLASHAMISYVVAGDGAADIHAQVLDDGTWSEEAEVVDQDKPITFYSSFYLSDSAGTSTPVFVYSSENTGSVDNPGDGSASLYSVTGGPLKRVSIEDILYDDAPNVPNSELTVNVVVTNSGTMPVEGVTVSVAQLGAADDEGVFEGSADQLLQPGESATVPVTLTLPAQDEFDDAEGLEFTAFAFPTDIRLQDFNRQNANCLRSFTIGDAALTVDATHILDSGGESIKATVVNEGIASSSGVLVFEDAATGAELARASIPALKARETFDYTYAAPKKLLSASGIKTVIVRIEGGNAQEGSIAAQTSVAAWVPGPNAIVGETYVVAGNTYKVTSNAKGTAMLVKAKNAKKVTVPATVSIEGKTYRVTAIGAKAFKSAKGKLKTVVLGKNVKSIGKRAFSGCKKLKKITVKTKKLKKKTVKNSLRGSSIKTVKVKVGGKKVNKKYKRKYKKVFKKKVCGKKVAIK